MAIDGKALRRSFDRGCSRGPIHMISAWAARQRLVSGQRAVGAKQNEITAIPEPPPGTFPAKGGRLHRD